MKTTSIMLQNLCVPCACHCRYCLLSWNGQTVGVDYDRSARYARRFHDWVAANRPELSFNFSFGYSMEHPKLFEALAFLRSIGSVSSEFLQCDGLRFRDDDEIEALMQGLTDSGVKHPLSAAGRAKTLPAFRCVKLHFVVFLPYNTRSSPFTNFILCATLDVETQESISKEAIA